MNKNNELPNQLIMIRKQIRHWKSDDVINYISEHKTAGNDLTLTLYRNGHPIDVKATLLPLLDHPCFRFLLH